MNQKIIVDNIPALGEILRSRFVEEASSAIARRGFFSVALTGGSLARTFFPTLATSDIDWNNVRFFWGDERGVPPDDPESNFAIANRLWFQPASVPPSSIYRIRGEHKDPELAASEYAETMSNVLGPDARLDLVLLGIGPDGHVCSLFPGHQLLEDELSLVASIDDSPKPPSRRITLTLGALRNAATIVVIALGEAKAAVVREALQEPESRLPVARVIADAKSFLFLMDPAAGRLLTNDGAPPNAGSGSLL